MAPQREVTLTIHGLSQLTATQSNYLIGFVKRDLEPLVRSAGRVLRFRWHSEPKSELNIHLEKGEKPKRTCGSFKIFGDCGGKGVYLADHVNLRVCGTPDPLTGKRDTRKVLSTDTLLAQALANTVLHELGHFIGDLDDNLTPGNFMSTGEPKGERTMRTLRNYYAVRQQWTGKQKEKLIQCLRNGRYEGEDLMKMEFRRL